MGEATIRDVARLAQVSIGTVSNYLNDTKQISPGTRKRIDSAVTELAFVPNRASQVMRGATSKIIGLIIPNIANPFYTELARGVEDAALEAGHVVVMCNTNGDPKREAKYLRAMHEMRATGVLLSLNQTGREQIQALRRSGIAVVLLDHRRKFTDISAVTSNDELGGQIAMSHLLELGHADVLFVGGPDGERPVEDRFTGARLAVESAGLPPSALRRINAPGPSLRDHVVVSDAIFGATMPSALFCSYDAIALAVQSTLARHGIVTPRDVSIIGYDDLEAAQLALVPLTSVSQPKYEQGYMAAQILISEARQPTEEWQEVIYSPRLMVRESTGKPREAAIVRN
jgi:LacI family transcriptional regulator